jgi:hypothetical protein
VAVLSTELWHREFLGVPAPSGARAVRMPRKQAVAEAPVAA